MKRQVLSLLLISLILFPVCGVISAAGATSQAPTAQPIEKMNNDGVRTGTVCTKIILLEPTGTVIPSGETSIAARVGDRITLHLKLIRSDTGAGIPDAAIGGTVSLDGKKWYTIQGGALITDSNGEIGPITAIIPDPRPIANQIPLVGSLVHLPMHAYVKATYAGDSTYLGNETVTYIVTLAP